jgi:Bacterial PH domain
MVQDSTHSIGPRAITDPVTAVGSARRNNAFWSEAKAGYGILVVFAAAFCLIALSVVSQSGAPDITLADSHLSIRSGAYAIDVPVADITAVQLVSRLSGIGAKRNAFQFGNVYHGRFAMEPFGDAMLFVDAMTPPYVLVKSTRGVVLFSARDSAKTMGLFAALSAQAGAR